MKGKKIKKEKLISLRIETELFDMLKKIAERDDRSLSNVVRIAIKQYLRRLNDDGKL